MAHYLQEIAKEELGLVFQYAKLVIKQSADEALQVPRNSFSYVVKTLLIAHEFPLTDFHQRSLRNGADP